MRYENPFLVTRIDDDITSSNIEVAFAARARWADAVPSPLSS
jgi:hypothetical protein